MNYSISEITTTEECDTLLQLAAAELGDLDFRKTQQNRQYATVSNGSVGVEADLIATNAEISAHEMAIANMPDGPTKTEYEKKLVKLKHKKFLLEDRMERYGLIALLQKEYAISCIEQQIAETEAYIANLNQRREEIG